MSFLKAQLIIEADRLFFNPQEFFTISSILNPFFLSFLQLRVLKTEQTVEEIVKERSLKAFNERCRQYYRADSF